MLRNTYVKIILGVIAAIAVLALLRFKPWQRGTQPAETADARASLNVGFLPVT